MSSSTHKPSLYTGAFGTYTLSTFVGIHEEEKDVTTADDLEELDIGPVDIRGLLKKKATVISGGPPADGETVQLVLECQKPDVSDAASASGKKRKPILVPRQNGVIVVGKWTVELELPETAADGKPLRKQVSIFVAQGSVTNFEGDVIVNAANNGCQDGGGVDGAITLSGGPLLALHRSKLPFVVDSECDAVHGYMRCDTGEAVMTPSGHRHPGSRLHCRYVVHAVGPNYGIVKHRHAASDKLLVAAYSNALQRCHEHNLTLAELSDERIAKRTAIVAKQFHSEDASYLATPTHISTVGFSLISSGIFRGSRSLRAVLRLGLTGIWEALEQCYSLDEVYMIAFRHNELATLMTVAPSVFGSGVAYDTRYVGTVETNESDDESEGESSSSTSSWTA